MPPLRPVTTTIQQTSTVHRVSIGLIAISLSLLSLALGTALFVSPGASFLFVPNEVTTQSAPSTATAVTLAWTAPGDDGTVGQATSYNLRYATSPITESNFISATSVTGLQIPAPAGSTESTTVTNLQPATTYFFALQTSDEAGNASAMSNVATKTTAALAQACVPTYACSTDWTACANGTQTRTCGVTNGCPAGLDAPIDHQTCTVPTTTTPGQGGEPVHVVKSIIVAGLAPGNQPLVRIIDPLKKTTSKQLTVFDQKDGHGVNVSAGDVTGDSQADVVVGTGVGTDPLVKVYNINGQLITSFNPYPTERQTGVAVATGDVNGDGIDEILTVPAKSAAQVRVWKFDAPTRKFKQLAQVFAYDRTARQGFTLAAGDLDLDGRAEIVVASRANARSVSILKLNSKNTLQVVRRFTPYPIQYATGITVAVGDVFGTGRASILTTAGPGYYSHLKVFDIRGVQQADLVLVSKAYRGGFSLSALDVNADGRDEILAGPYKNSDPSLRVYRYNGLTKKFQLLQNYLLYPRTLRVGLRLGST